MSDDDPRALPFDEPATAPPAAPDPAENVLEFRRRSPQDDDKLDALARAPRPAVPCRHERKRYVDEVLRRVTCGDCGENLDPIWCLLNLIAFRETLRRERNWIEGERRQVEERRTRAIARRQKEAAKVQATKVRENCQACGGTGWASREGGGVERCSCRKQGAKLL